MTFAEISVAIERKTRSAEASAKTGVDMSEAQAAETRRLQGELRALYEQARAMREAELAPLLQQIDDVRLKYGPIVARAHAGAHLYAKRLARWKHRQEVPPGKGGRPKKPTPAVVARKPRSRPRPIGSNPIMARDVWAPPAATDEENV